MACAAGKIGMATKGKIQKKDGGTQPVASAASAPAKKRRVGKRGQDGLTIKQERFAAAFVETGNASEAYRRAYDAKRMKAETVNRAAHDVLLDPKVAARIAGLREGAAKRARETVDDLLIELEDARKLAMTSPRSCSAAVSATHVKAKILGLITQKVQTDLNVNPSAPNPLKDSLMSEIAKEDAAAKHPVGDDDGEGDDAEAASSEP